VAAQLPPEPGPCLPSEPTHESAGKEEQEEGNDRPGDLTVDVRLDRRDEKRPDDESADGPHEREDLNRRPEPETVQRSEEERGDEDPVEQVQVILPVLL
jgi:hypothetical protein